MGLTPTTSSPRCAPAETGTANLIVVGDDVRHLSATVPAKNGYLARMSGSGERRYGVAATADDNRSHRTGHSSPTPTNLGVRTLGQTRTAHPAWSSDN